MLSNAYHGLVRILYVVAYHDGHGTTELVDKTFTSFSEAENYVRHIKTFDSGIYNIKRAVLLE